MDTREKAYQFAVYSSVSFALVSILSVCVTLPMVYNYVQTMHENVRVEAGYCKVSSSLVPCPFHFLITHALAHQSALDASHHICYSKHTLKGALQLVVRL